MPINQSKLSGVPAVWVPRQRVERHAIRWGLICLGLLLCAPVAAQEDEAIAPAPAVSSDASADGGGLGSGLLTFHPGIKLTGGVDSNVFFDDDQEDPQSAFTLGVVPSIGLESRPGAPVKFNLEADLQYLQYFSDLDQVVDQSGFSIGADGSVVFNPDGAVALRLRDTLRRTNEAPNGFGLESFSRTFNHLEGGIIFQPGGKLLQVEVGGSFDLFLHDVTSDLDNQALGLDLRASWKFFPKTAIKLLVDWDFITYGQRERELISLGNNTPGFLDPFEGDQGLQNINSQPLRIQGGVAGLLGNRFSVVLLAGFGKGFYDSGEDFSSVIGRAELGYEIGPTSRMRLGYIRDFTDSSFGNFFAFHKVYTRYNQQFFGRLDLNLEGAFTLQQYANNPGPILDQVSVDGVLGARAFSDPNRVDPVFAVSAGAQYFFTDFFFAGADYKLDANTSDFVMITGIRSDVEDPNDINSGGVAISQFVKHRVFLSTGVRW